MNLLPRKGLRAAPNTAEENKFLQWGDGVNGAVRAFFRVAYHFPTAKTNRAEMLIKFSI